MLETLERLIFDPISEVPPYQVAANRPLEITGNRTPGPVGHGIFLVDHSYPRPEMQSTFATSRDSQGEKRFGRPKFANRKIPIKVYVAEASGVGATTNLLKNPSAELSAAFFNLGKVEWTEATLTRETALSNEFHSAGEFVLRVVAKKDATTTGRTLSVTQRSDAGTITPGKKYSFAVSVFMRDVIESGLKVRIDWYTAANAFISSSPTSTAFTGVEEARLKIEGAVAPANASQATVVLVGTSTTSGDTVDFWADAWQLEEGEFCTAYVDGDTPGCLWNGTPHESISRRIGSGRDRKRFVRSLYDLQEKIEKLAEEGGTFKRVLPDGSYMVFDIEEASFVGEWAKQFNQGQQEFSFELTCKPGARLEPVTLSVHEEKTLPILTFMETDIPGNLLALGDLLVEDTQGVNREFVAVAVASRYLDQSANGEVFYQAENRMRLSGAGLAVGSGTPSGSEANKVVSCGLFEEFTPYLSTRSSAGAYTSHIGAQKMFARVYFPAGNLGTISLRLEYAQGDLLRWKMLPAVPLDATASKLGGWMLIDLGTVRLNRSAVGTQRWEGRLSAKSTVTGDTIQIDWLGIMPVEEFYGEARALTVSSSGLGPQVARDNFTQTAGVLAAKTATVGGAWSLAGGDADDFSVSTFGGGTLQRVPGSVDVSGANNDPAPLGVAAEAATGRYMRLGTGVIAGVAVSLDIYVPTRSSTLQRAGVFARYVNMSNFLMARMHWVYGLGIGSAQVYKKVAGVWTYLTGTSFNSGATGLVLTVLPDGSGSLAVRAGGLVQVSASWLPTSDLATGGVLQSGGYGVHHTVSDNPEQEGAGTPDGNLFDNFTVREVSEQPQDAVIYANKDLRLRWDKTLRESSDGSGAFSDVGTYVGDRLLIPHSGREARPARISILASRSLPGQGVDLQADDIKGTLTVIPRVIEVPEAA